MKKQAVQRNENDEKADKLRQNKKVSFCRPVIEKIDKDRERFHILSATEMGIKKVRFPVWKDNDQPIKQ
ncbi:MAG: hypothetical protein D3910_10320 [Candidatus Electrothrix sp. ATG2]|nr:hypothetical protein [Candidatus Electrothrix sp. ATG2]